MNQEAPPRQQLVRTIVGNLSAKTKAVASNQSPSELVHSFISPSCENAAELNFQGWSALLGTEMLQFQTAALRWD